MQRARAHLRRRKPHFAAAHQRHHDRGDEPHQQQRRDDRILRHRCRGAFERRKRIDVAAHAVVRILHGARGVDQISVNASCAGEGHSSAENQQIAGDHVRDGDIAAIHLHAAIDRLLDRRRLADDVQVLRERAALGCAGRRDDHAEDGDRGERRQRKDEPLKHRSPSARAATERTAAS